MLDHVCRWMAEHNDVPPTYDNPPDNMARKTYSTALKGLENKRRIRRRSGAQGG